MSIPECDMRITLELQRTLNTAWHFPFHSFITSSSQTDISELRGCRGSSSWLRGHLRFLVELMQSGQTDDLIVTVRGKHTLRLDDVTSNTTKQLHITAYFKFYLYYDPWGQSRATKQLTAAASPKRLIALKQHKTQKLNIELLFKWGSKSDIHCVKCTRCFMKVNVVCCVVLVTNVSIDRVKSISAEQ